MIKSSDTEGSNNKISETKQSSQINKKDMYNKLSSENNEKKSDDYSIISVTDKKNNSSSNVGIDNKNTDGLLESDKNATNIDSNDEDDDWGFSFDEGDENSDSEQEDTTDSNNSDKQSDSIDSSTSKDTTKQSSSVDKSNTDKDSNKQSSSKADKAKYNKKHKKRQKKSDSKVYSENINPDGSIARESIFERVGKWSDAKTIGVVAGVFGLFCVGMIFAYNFHLSVPNVSLSHRGSSSKIVLNSNGTVDTKKTKNNGLSGATGTTEYSNITTHVDSSGNMQVHDKVLNKYDLNLPESMYNYLNSISDNYKQFNVADGILYIGSDTTSIIWKTDPDPSNDEITLKVYSGGKDTTLSTFKDICNSDKAYNIDLLDILDKINNQLNSSGNTSTSVVSNDFYTANISNSIVTKGNSTQTVTTINITCE